MELHTVNGVLRVLHRHHLAVGGAGGDFKFRRQGGGVCRQRVIPRHQQRGFAAFEQRARGVEFHRRLLAVHELFCIGDGGPKGRADGLMPKADAQSGNFFAEGAGSFQRDAGILRPAGPRRKDDACRAQRADLVDGQFVVADDPDAGVQLAYQLIKVIGKAVVVINEKRHTPSSCA